MNARLALTDQAEDLISVFTDELVAAGLTPWPSVVSGARGFCARYPTPAAFCAASVDEQLELRNHQRRFACWLMVTARMPVSAEYLARADLRLGAVSARHYPDLRAKFADVAVMLGSDEVWVRAQWSALAQLAADTRAHVAAKLGPDVTEKYLRDVFWIDLMANGGGVQLTGGSISMRSVAPITRPAAPPAPTTPGK